MTANSEHGAICGVWGNAVASFLVALPALFSIVNPIAGALIYNQVTAARGHSERAVLAWRVAIYAAIVILFSLWIGASLMSFFGVSIEALRIAGGLVVSAAAWDMLYNSHAQGRARKSRPPTLQAVTATFFRSPCRSRPGRERSRSPSR